MTRRHYHRDDGWTPGVREDFIVALIEHGSIPRAAASVDRHITSAYRLRHRDPGFARAWDAARRMAHARLRDAALDRALNGTVHEMWHDGEQTGMKTVHGDRLLIALLNHLQHDPPPCATVDDAMVDDEEDRGGDATARVLALLKEPPPAPRAPAPVRLRPARLRLPGAAGAATIDATASHP